MGCASSQDATATGDPIDESSHESIARAASIKISRQLQSDFGDKYTLGEHLGEGNSATVFKARNKKTGQEYAVKCIGKVDAEGNLLDKDSEESLEKEVEILQGVRNHPYILHLEEYMQDGIYHYLVTELIEGGELFDRIISKQFYSEAEARDLVKTLLEAVQFLHDKNIAHRDLKPENLLLKSGDDDSSIKIADFGFADITYNDDDLVLPCGTPNYAAPEILQGQNYGRQVDVWSIGVITYILLCGYPPFHDDVQSRLFDLIKNAQYEFNSPYWDPVSPEAREMIASMLTLDPSKRATCKELLACKWITGTGIGGSDVVYATDLTGAQTELKAFRARRKFKAAVRTVQTVHRMSRIMKAVRAERLEKLAAAELVAGNQVAPVPDQADGGQGGGGGGKAEGVATEPEPA